MLVVQDHAVVLSLSSELNIFSLFLPEISQSEFSITVGYVYLGVSLFDLSLEVPDLSLQFVNIVTVNSFITEMELFNTFIFWLTLWSVPIQINLIMNGLQLELV